MFLSSGPPDGLLVSLCKTILQLPLAFTPEENIYSLHSVAVATFDVKLPDILKMPPALGISLVKARVPVEDGNVITDELFPTQLCIVLFVNVSVLDIVIKFFPLVN